jgi:hypothetical protein
MATPATVPAAVMNVVNAASPGYPDSHQKWWGQTQGDTSPDVSHLATGATAGTPGAWTPTGSTPPPTVAKLIAGDPVTVAASPAGAWTTGQYVQTGTAGAPGEANWSGTAWVAGKHA